MLDINLFLETLRSFIEANPLLISFFGPLIGGEPVFILLAFMSSQGIIPLWALFVFGATADFIYDLFWFFSPRLKLLKKVPIPKFLVKKYKEINKNFKNVEDHELPLFIMSSKLLIGTRLITLISISLNKIKAKKFIFFSFISTIIWSIILIIIGWSAGKGFTIANEIFKSTRITLTIVLILLAIFFTSKIYLHRKFHTKIIGD